MGARVGVESMGGGTQGPEWGEGHVGARVGEHRGQSRGGHGVHGARVGACGGQSGGGVAQAHQGQIGGGVQGPELGIGSVGAWGRVGVCEGQSGTSGVAGRALSHIPSPLSGIPSLISGMPSHLSGIPYH